MSPLAWARTNTVTVTAGIAGPRVKRGGLTREAALAINTEDTGATACYLLGLPQLSYFDGKPVLAAFENSPVP